MAEVLIAEPVDILQSQEHKEALALMLRLGGVVYLPADGLGAVPGSAYAWTAALEALLPGALVTYMGRNVLSGPLRLYGRERVRVELRRGM